MDEKNLLICDKDLRYASVLGENIMRRKELAFRVHICTCAESVYEFGKEKGIDVLIVDESFSEEEREKMKAQQVFVLTENKVYNPRNREHGLYKFQPADKILANVLDVFDEKKDFSVLKSGCKTKGNLIAVYSPIHRIGKTEFALGLGMELAQKSKTLYINLEEYSDIGGRFALSEGRNLGDLLYYTRQEESNLALRLSTVIREIGELDYIPPIPMSVDLKEISLEEWKQFFAAILQETTYETVILDLGESVQGLLEILQMCHKIYMPTLEDAISKRKIRQFEEEVTKMNKEMIKRKTYQFIAVSDMSACGRQMVEEEE